MDIVVSSLHYKRLAFMTNWERPNVTMAGPSLALRIGMPWICGRVVVAPTVVDAHGCSRVASHLKKHTRDHRDLSPHIVQ